MNTLIKKTGNFAFMLGFAINTMTAPNFTLNTHEFNGKVESVLVTKILVSEPEKETMEVTITAYSSTEDQTDDSPFIAASGKRVHDGMIAANFLPFGAKVKIPELFGDKIFTVNDRMNRRFNTRVDIWFPDRETAINFGIKTAEIVIL